MMSITHHTYASRAANQPNAAAKQLLQCIERKQSNLCVSVDVTTKQQLLDVCDAVGPDVCLIKTHIDIVDDFDLDLVHQLTELSKKHDFLIFEDRKFADIGNTVSLQYSSGVHKIASWSHITNAHLVPGPNIITGLASVGQSLGRGLLLLAEMSSAGALTKGSYTHACVEAARNDTTGFVCGFIAMSRVDEADSTPNAGRDLIILTPGVGLDVKADAMGQQYRTPDQVIRQSGCDVIIVGRGVYGSLMTPEGKQDKATAFVKVGEQAKRYKKAGWEAYLARLDEGKKQASTVTSSSSDGVIASAVAIGKRKAIDSFAAAAMESEAPRRSVRRKLFAPAPSSSTLPDGSPSQADQKDANKTSSDHALATSLAAAETVDGARYSLRRRIATAAVADTPELSSKSSSSSTVTKNTTGRRSSTRVVVAVKKEDIDPESDAVASDSDSGSEDEYADASAQASATSALSRRRSTQSPTKSSVKAKTTSPSKSVVLHFSISPRKATKPIKLDLLESESQPAPERWEETYALLVKQRSRIIAPVDTMGCEENGRDDRRADSWRVRESEEEEQKRKRLTTLVSLMLSSQTKDPVTAEAVSNLQRTLPGGLTLSSLLTASDSTISSCICKVGFWRRKTGYLKSAAHILSHDFGGDVPSNIDDLLTLPGVGPKMAFLALSSMGIQIGIGVDTHVHRLSNRLGWCKTKDAEGTRLRLQSWVPKELHGKINKLLVGFGQVICVPIGPRCDLCLVGSSGLCPSYNPPTLQSTLKRVKVDLLNSDEENERGENWSLPPGYTNKEEGRAKVKVEVEVEVQREPQRDDDGWYGIGELGSVQDRDWDQVNVKVEGDVKKVQKREEQERALEW